MLPAYAYVLDTSAWSALFEGSPASARIEEALDGAAAGTSVLSVAELSDIYHRTPELAAAWEEALEFVETATDILPVLVPIAAKAGGTKTRRRASVPRFGLADAIILETARFYGATLLTTDADLKGMRGVEWLRR